MADVKEMFRKAEAAVAAWQAKHPRIAGSLETISFVLIYAIYYLAFIILPLQLFHFGMDLSAPQGPANGENIVLPTGVKLMWGAAVLAMFVLSAIAAGFQKWVLSQFGRWSLLAGLAVAAVFLLGSVHAVADVAGRMDRLRDDNALIIGFLGAWLIVLGYLSKLPWDEAREQWFQFTKQANPEIQRR